MQALLHEGGGEEASLKQTLITDFAPIRLGLSQRTQITLDGLVIPIYHRNTRNGGVKTDRDCRLFHFYDDPSPVLTVERVRVSVSDGRAKFRLSSLDVLERLVEAGRVEVRHFGAIRSEHSLNLDGCRVRINLGAFYSFFYDSGEEFLVKMEGDRPYIVTKVGENPEPYLQFRLASYRASPSGRGAVETTRGFIIPKEFYEALVREFPSALTVTGRAKRFKEFREKRYINMPEDY